MAATQMKLWRIRRGIPQWRLARDAGVSESALSRIETGRAMPNPALATQLARLLAVPEADLWAPGSTDTLAQDMSAPRD